MSATSFRLAVLGDLHYEPSDSRAYQSIRSQILKLKPQSLVSLGDLGGYSHCGTLVSFEEGRDFFSKFAVPYYTLLGNHDLEGKGFQTDGQNIAAWQKVFGYAKPYQAVESHGWALVLLSTTRFRENERFQHEIVVDEEQLSWFAETLRRYRDRPVAVFSHAPILGSGLRVIQSLHLKFGNAWLNHTHGPERFLGMVRQNPNVKLWFSAHNHLSQDYPDSLGQAGECTFVHVGVMGRVSRDGRFQSRIADLLPGGFELSTLDHMTAALRCDLKTDFAGGTIEQMPLPPSPFTPEFNPPPPFPEKELSLRLGTSVFAAHDDALVEYDAQLKAPLGLVVERLDGRRPVVEAGHLFLTGGDGNREELRPLFDGRYMRWARK